MKIKVTEGQVQSAISDYLSLKKIIHWRVNNGAMIKEDNNKTRFIKFVYWLFPSEDENLKFLDIGGLMPDGRALFIECKATDEKPTISQMRTIKFLNEKNAIALWANSIDMFIEKFELILKELAS